MKSAYLAALAVGLVAGALVALWSVQNAAPQTGVSTTQPAASTSGGAATAATTTAAITTTTSSAAAISFEVEGMRVVDVGGYPTLEVAFKSDARPIYFKLFRGGAEVSTYNATGGVAYLRLSYRPYANLAREVYTVVAYYRGREVWSGSVSVEGPRPAFEVLGVGARADAAGLEIDNLTLSVENLGDAPLYLTPDVLSIYLDGAEVAAGLNETVVEPNATATVEVRVYASISRYAVGYAHVVTVGALGSEAQYVIGPPALNVTILSTSLNGTTLEAQVEILNGWAYPLDVRWLDVAVSGVGAEASWSPTAPIGPGGSAVYTLTVEGVEPGSEVAIYLDGVQQAQFSAPLSCRAMPYRAIFWIVPWGRTDSRPPYCSTPGIVVVIPCTPGASADWTQFKTSLALIGQYRGGELFVNLFCAAPDWRGNLKQIDLSYASDYLNALKAYLGDGSGAYMGFSEMTACVADAACRSELAEAYRELKSMFPAARLFYYGTSSESPRDILDLAAQAGLDLVGEDIYDYVYSNGVLQVPQYFLANLKALKASGLPVMVGEVGFRICDAQGYIQPWNWQRPVERRNCSATITFYSQVLPQLASAGPEYIGIWAWNDPAYGVALSPEVATYFKNLLGG
ncbi:MAG: hypothetical protein ABWJ97_03765, partial [Thermoproteus sp.]